jgi:hypothetical protein
MRMPNCRNCLHAGGDHDWKMSRMRRWCRSPLLRESIEHASRRVRYLQSLASDILDRVLSKQYPLGLTDRRRYRWLDHIGDAARWDFLEGKKDMCCRLHTYS